MTKQLRSTSKMTNDPSVVRLYVVGSLFFISLIGLLCFAPLLINNQLFAKDKVAAKEQTTSAGSSDGQPHYTEIILKKEGITPDQQGILDYLSKLHPSDKNRAAIEKLVKQLGSPIYRERIKASHELIHSPYLPVELLKKALQSDDSEMQYRARIVLERAALERTPILRSIFELVIAKKYSKCIDPILKAVPFCEEEYVRKTAYRAIREIATRDDLPALRKALKSSESYIVAGAIIGLGKVDNDTEIKELHPYLAASKTGVVQFHAAKELANRGDRKSMTALVNLLSDKNLKIRTEGIAVLKKFCKQKFGYSAHGKEKDRAQSIKKWRDWVNKQGLSAKLHFPLKTNSFYQSHLNGNTLLAYGYQNRVVELDPRGKEVWSYTGARGVWSAEKLANGNVLLASYHNHNVTQVNRNKQVVWEFKVKNPLNARPLANGNFLISGNRMLQEVTPEKKVVWQYQPPNVSQIADAQRLPNGNTLVVVSGEKIVEVDRNKKVVWSYPCASPYGVQPLPNGNVLISLIGGRVVEVDRNRTIVWSVSATGPCDAFRLPNGNTLITGNREFIEVDPKGKKVWSKSGCSYGTARR